MNLFVFVLLIFSTIGFIDKMFQLRLGLAESFDHGLQTMGPLTLSIVGICSVGVTFIQNHLDSIVQMTVHLPFDASLIIGALFAPDIGGFTMTQEITQVSALVIFNGIILSSMLGQTISFQFPIFLSAIPKEEHGHLMKGFIIGIILVPVGLLFAELLIQMPLSLFLHQWIPILIICSVIAIFIMKFPNQTILFFRGIASMIQWLTYLLFFVSVVGVFFPQYAYAPTSLVLDSILTAFKISIIVCGSLVLSDLILKQFKKQIHSLASILEINDFAMMGLILSCATSIAILPLYQKMDAKGKLLNAAFAVSGAYFLGGQLGYISNIVSSGSIVVVYLLTKIVCGILSIVVMSFVSSKKELSITDDNII